jgi:hypothetical protein
MNLYELLIAEQGSQTELHFETLFSDENMQKLEAESDKDLFALLRKISSLYMKDVENGVPFGPMIVLADGNRSFSLEDLSDLDYEKLKTLETERLPLPVKARLTDVLWTKHKDLYQYGIIAAQSYLELYKALFSRSEYHQALRQLKRSLNILSQIKKNDLRDQAYQCLYDDVTRMNGEDEGFFSLWAIEIIIDHQFGNMRPLLQIIDRIIQESQDHVRKVEYAYQIKANYYIKAKKLEKARKTRLELADYYVDFANRFLGDNMQGAFTSEKVLHKAIILCKENGASERANDLHKQLIEIQKVIPGQMVPMSITVNTKKYKEIVDANMEGLSFQESILRLNQFIHFSTREEIKDKVIHALHKAPLSHLFGRTIVNTSGQPVLALAPLDMSNPESDQKLLEKYMHQALLEDQALMGKIWLDYIFYYIRNHYFFCEDDLDFIFKNNPIVPKGRERIIRSAVYMVLKGQFYEAVHILAPQTENIFRTLAKEVGAITITLESDGTSKEKTLTSIFSLRELNECYDNDILFTFKGLLNEEAGANIRNEIAHGLLNEVNACTGVCLFFDATVIKLLLLTSPEAYSVYKSSEKLQCIKKLELLETDMTIERKQS